MLFDVNPGARRLQSWLPLSLTLLAGLSAGFFVQISTLAHLKVAFKAAGLGGGRAISLGGLLDLARTSLRPADWIAVCILLLALLALVILEVRGRAVTRALRAALDARVASWLFLAFIAAVAVRPYLDAGIPHAFDGKLHFAKLLAVSDCLREGEWPSWSWRWYLGMPLLRFYGPSFHIPAAGGTLIGLSAGASLKLFLVCAFLLSGLGVHRFAGAITGSRPAATVSAAAWLLALPPLHALLDLGRLPESVLYAAFPWLLLSVERFVREGRLRWAAATGALLAIALLGHPRLALVSAGVTAVYGIIRLAGSPVHRRHPLPAMLFAAGSAAMALALAAFWLVPALSEVGAIRSGGGVRSELGLLVPDGINFGALQRLIDRRSPHASLASVSYAGWTVIILAVVGILSLFRRNRVAALSVAVAAGLCIAYVGGSYFQSRSVAFLTVFLSVATGAAFSEPSVLGRFRVAALFFLLLDLVPLGLVSPFRPDLEPVLRDLRALAPQVAGQKVVVVSLRTGKPEVSQWTGWDDSGIAVLGGPFREAATDVYSFGMAALGRVRDDLEGPGSFSATTVDSLRLLGVAAIVFEDGSGLRVPPVKPGRGYSVSTEPPAVFLTGSGPAMFSESLVSPSIGLQQRMAALRPLDDIPSPEAMRDGWPLVLDELVALHGPDSGSPRVDRIVVTGAEPGVDSGRSADPPRFAVSTAGHLEVSFRAETTAPGVLLLPFAGYPGVRVLVDGVERRTLTTAMGTMALPLEAGQHWISVRGPRGLGAGRSAWLALLAVVVAGVALLWPRRGARWLA